MKTRILGSSLEVSAVGAGMYGIKPELPAVSG